MRWVAAKMFDILVLLLLLGIGSNLSGEASTNGLISFISPAFPWIILVDLEIFYYMKLVLFEKVPFSLFASVSPFVLVTVWSIYSRFWLNWWDYNSIYEPWVICFCGASNC